MLSETNKELLKFNAYYECEPNVKYRGCWHENSLYHCCNWVFELCDYQGTLFMKDTYWGGLDSVMIEITDENINDFKFIVYKDDLIKIEKWEWENYNDNDCLRLAVDSGGWSYAKYFKRKNTKPDKELILSNIEYEIEEAKRNLVSLERKKQEVLDGTHYLLR